MQQVAGEHDAAAGRRPVEAAPVFGKTQAAAVERIVEVDADREAARARRIEAVDAEGYSLQYREDEQLLTMRFELGANGLARVGGRKSFAWRREGEP